MKNIISIILAVLPFICNCQVIVNDAASKEYFENGVPLLNRDWTAEEYVNAINILIDLSDNDILPLPENKTGKEILDKIVRYEDYWFLQSKEFTHIDKILFCVDIQGSISRLYLKYQHNSRITNDFLNYGEEIIAIQITLIKLMDKMLEQTDEFLLANPDLTEVQKDGFRKFKHGLNIFTYGIFLTIRKDFIYFRESNICDLSEIFFSFYKKNRYSLDDDARNEFDIERINISKNHTIECVKNFALVE